MLSDVVLPGGIGGLEFHDKSQQDHPELKYIFMSGYAETREKVLPEGLRYGAAIGLGAPVY